MHLPLNALRAFEASARHLNLTRAAQELHVTQTAVSQHIRKLEDRLGKPLFRRLPRGLALTRGGARPGDSVFVSGTLGDASAALERIRAGRAMEGAQARALAREFWQCVADDARVSQAFREMARAHVAPLAPALP